MSSAGQPPHLFITLFASRNETLIGELNMTGMTLPRKDTRGGSSSASSSSSDDDVGTSASASASFARSGYDSRGAAYYICIVILVYALAIAAFVVSLARRRNNTRDKYRLAHDQVVDCRQEREERGRRGQGGCWKQRCSGSSEVPGMPSSSPWSSSASSSSSNSSNSGMALHRRLDNLDLERPKVVTAMGLAPSTCVQVDPDEVITLVQVLPYSNRSSSSGSGGGGSRDGSKTFDADGGALHCDEDDDAANIPCDGGLEEDEQQQQKRFRWSMGPDGNIWILQVDDAVAIDDATNNNNDNNDNNDNTSSNNALGCQSQPKTDPVGGELGGGDQGPNPPFKDTPLVQSCPSSATVAKGSHLSSGPTTVQQTMVADQQRRSKNHAASFSPVPRGYRPRGRSTSRERKARLFRSDEQGPKVTFPTGSYHCSSTTAERTINCSLVNAREHHWEEYHFLDPDPPFCLPLPLLSPHLMQKLIHVTSV